MNSRKWICLILFATATLLTPSVLGHSSADKGQVVLADGTAPPPPPIPYGHSDLA
jgi:hypothetical protein